MNIKKGDTVLIISGKDRAKTGMVEKTLPKSGKIIVTGINIIKKATKPSRRNPKGGIMQIPGPIDMSNAALICSKCGKKTKTFWKRVGRKKMRYCKLCKDES